MMFNGYKFGLAPNAFIHSKLDALAAWFHYCFITSVVKDDSKSELPDNGWGFNDQNWKVGPVSDPDSATAFLFQLLQWGAHFHLVTKDKDEDFAALAVTVRLDDGVLAHPSYQLAQWGARPSDLYFAVYLVSPEHRGHKLASMLIDQTVLHGRTMEGPPEQFWVRTHDHHMRVIPSFQERGLAIAGRYKVVQFGETTNRVVLGAKFSGVKTLAELRG